MRFNPESGRAHFIVAFTCVGCTRSFSRFVRHDPESVRRCLMCESAYVREVSERLLDQVRGGDRRPGA